MKKLLFGLALFMTGGLSCVILIAGAMQGTAQGEGIVYSVWSALARYGLVPLFWVLAAVGLLGLLVALDAMLLKKE